VSAAGGETPRRCDGGIEEVGREMQAGRGQDRREAGIGRRLLGAVENELKHHLLDELRRS
jgi:hypothetical protein